MPTQNNIHEISLFLKTELAGQTINTGFLGTDKLTIDKERWALKDVTTLIDKHPVRNSKQEVCMLVIFFRKFRCVVISTGCVYHWRSYECRRTSRSKVFLRDAYQDA